MFICIICNKSFNIKRNILRHEKTHNGNRFDCEKCNANFTYKTHCTYQVKKMHPTTELGLNIQHSPPTQIKSVYIPSITDDILLI